ncbi:hypothetical protein [Spirosoma radiotolerans]|uniref:3-keto-disaccharide hydrolase domain-containing protein n=1 Tax=Spirosoma radiotolerans TaxID=1379870 RepID=A0A0E3ZXL5_9BACT|nr:hypothetical protein [Spirosoma radiotolerans]AKD56454.1 hypothetical protein SD10_17605 [Spirosoma radiotolerans]
MRFYLIIAFIPLFLTSSFAQSAGRREKSALYSASSEWQKVTLKPTARLQTNQPVNAPVSPATAAPAERTETGTVSTPLVPARPSTLANSTADYRPAFAGDFATNRNGWKAGTKGDYYYQIGLGRYSIRKRNTNTQQIAFSAVELPRDINLNNADFFTIKVDVLADSGRIPTGGVLFGVVDSLNYNAFTLNEKGEVAVVRVSNGKTVSDYMPADFFSPGVSVEKNRNRLSIQRKGEELHFYVNAQEIRSSPYPFKLLAGNGIGLTSSGYWTSFQKLTVTLGP